MRVVQQSWSFEVVPDGEAILRQIEQAGRTCYKSEDKATADSARKFVSMLIRNGHHSVLEHVGLSVRIITDRGVTHELVRHRLVAYSQESTRYCRYDDQRFGSQIAVIQPTDLAENTTPWAHWAKAMEDAETAYFKLLGLGVQPQIARSVLPTCLKTEIVTTANLREWRHILTLRTSPKAHPQMRALMLDVLAGFQKAIPVVFDDIGAE